MHNEGEIVLKGKWLYDNTIECGIVIQKCSVIFGSGDYEDPSEIRNDQIQENYYVWFCSPNEPENYKNGGGYGITLEEAKVVAQQAVNSPIQWGNHN